MIEEYTVKKIDEEIEKYVSIGNSNIEKGSLFCKWILKYMFEQSEDEIDQMCEIDGKSDNSIDAFFEEEKTLKVIQAKYNTSHKCPEVAKFTADLRRLIKQPKEYVGDNPYIEEVTEKISI